MPSRGIASFSAAAPEALTRRDVARLIGWGTEKELEPGGQDALPAPHQLARGPLGGGGSSPFSRTQFPHPSLEGLDCVI